MPPASDTPEMLHGHPQIIALNGARVRVPAGSVGGAGRLVIGAVWQDYLPLPTQLLIRPGGRLQLNGDFSLYTGASVCIEASGSVSLGHGFVNTGFRMVCWHAMRFGDQATIAENVTMRDADNHWISGGSATTSGIELGRRVWIGLNATILKNVRLGDGVIIGAGSVVTQNVEAGWLAAGNPARPIRRASWG